MKPNHEVQEIEKRSLELRKLKTDYELLFRKFSLSEDRVLQLEKELDSLLLGEVPGEEPSGGGGVSEAAGGGPNLGLSPDISPNQFRKTLISLKEETERLRYVYPAEDLLALKELEVEKASKALASITEIHSSYQSFALQLLTLTQERDECRKIVLKAEERFKRQILRIRTAGLMVPFEVHTVDSKPADVSQEQVQERAQKQAQEISREISQEISQEDVREKVRETARDLGSGSSFLESLLPPL